MLLLGGVYMCLPHQQVSAKTKKKTNRLGRLHWKQRKVALADNTQTKQPTTSVQKRAPNSRLKRLKLLPSVSWKAISSKGYTGQKSVLPKRHDKGWPVWSFASVLARVRKQNLDLKLLRRRIKQSQIMRSQAWGAVRPTLQLQGNYIRNSNEASVNMGSESIVITPYNQWTMSMQLNWNIFHLPSIPNIKAAYLDVQKTKQLAKQTQREVVYASLQAYYSILLSDGMVEIARQSWANAKEHMQIAKLRTSAGISTRFNVMRAKLDVVKAQQTYLSAINALRNTRLSLLVLLNEQNGHFRVTAPSRPKSPSGTVVAWLSSARKQRPELKEKKLAIQSAEAKLTGQWLQFAPTIALTGAVQANNAGGFANQYVQWNVGLAARLPLYNGGARFDAIQQANNALKQAQLEYQKADLTIRNEIKQADINLRNSVMNYRVARNQKKIAEETYQLNVHRYKAGLASPIALSDALTQLTSARISVLRERFNMDLAVLQLHRSMGTLSKIAKTLR